MDYDINKIMQEYGDDDFGFTAVDEVEYEAVIAEKDGTVQAYQDRLKEVEKIIPEAVKTMFNGYKAVNYSLVFPKVNHA